MSHVNVIAGRRASGNVLRAGEDRIAPRCECWNWKASVPLTLLCVRFGDLDETFIAIVAPPAPQPRRCPDGCRRDNAAVGNRGQDPVSYTHLTLPTSDLV